jgi:hypothetical protein
MPATVATSRSERVIYLLLGLTPVVFGLSILYLGQDISWDLRNYHYYNPFAYLTGRMGHDVAVSHVATYYNPLIYIPFYYIVTWLPPKAVGFILGFLPGLNVFPIYGITRQVVGPGRPGNTAWLCLGLTLAGVLGAINLAEIGTSFGDNIVSLPMLAAAWLIVRFRQRLCAAVRTGWPIAAAAGLLAGSALGLKQPFAIYCVGLCLAFFGLDAPFWRRFALAFIFGLGVLAGTALTGGFWLLEMWQRFRNPLFPYFNEFFKSPWGAIGSYRDERYIPKNPAMWLLFPFWFNFDPTQVGEVGFRDLRFPLLYVLLLALLICALRRRLQTPGSADPHAGGLDGQAMTRFFAIFMVVSFFLWMKLFAVYRYAVVCEFLAPLTIFLVLGALLRNPRRQLRASLACLVFLLVTLDPGHWGRRPWTSDYFDVNLPALAKRPDALVLVTGHDPIAYMIPFFPPQVRFLRIQGFVTGPSATLNATDRLMMRALAEHKGPVGILYRSYEEWHALNALEFYELELDRSSCQSFVPGVEPQQEHLFYLCRVTPRISPLKGTIP